MNHELLENAAKALGIEFFFLDGVPSTKNRLGFQIPWNPLENDDDAMKLSVELFMHVMPSKEQIIVEWNEGLSDLTSLKVVSKVENDDVLQSARKAIVILAAEIGKVLK